MCTFRRIVIGIVVGVTISRFGVPYYNALPSWEALVRTHCGVPANIDAYAICLALVGGSGGWLFSKKSPG